MLTLYDNLTSIDINNNSTLLSNILKALITSLRNIRLASILIYNDRLDTLVYQEIEYNDLERNGLDKNYLVELLKDNIILNVDNSVYCDLIRSDIDIMILDNVLESHNYRSKELASLLELKAGVFLKLSNKRNDRIYGIIDLYPSDKEFFITYDTDNLQGVIRLVENLILAANLIREDKVFNKIFNAAIKVSMKKIETFLDMCVKIISDEIHAKECSIFVVDPSDKLIKLKASLQGEKPAKVKKELSEHNDVYYKIGEGVTGKIVEIKEVFVSNDIDLSCSKWEDKESSKTFVGIPILDVDEKKAIGVIRCTTKTNSLLGSVECFNQEDVDFLVYASKVIGKFMEIYFYRENIAQLLTKMPHELSASLRNIYSICEYIELMNRRQAGQVSYDLNKSISDIKDEVNISMMNINNVAIFDQNISEYNFEYIDIFTEIIPRAKKYLIKISRTERNIGIRYSKDPKFPKMYLDKNKMQAVFHNLLMNAIKYSYTNKYHEKKNDIVINGKCCEDGTYKISISNFGISIPENLIDDIFINGVRSIEAQRIDPGGKGFGLAFVKNIIEMHQAKIYITNLGNPTILSILFPKWLAHTSPEHKNEVNDDIDH